MELLGFFKHLINRENPSQKQETSPKLQQQEEAIRQRVKRQQEDLVRQGLIGLYTNRESTLVDMAASGQKNTSGGDVDSRRFAYDTGNHFIRRTGEITEAFEERVLSTIGDPQRRRTLHEEALKSAKTYWEEALAGPDNPTDVLMLGRRRLTQISGSLEKLAVDPNQPKPQQP